MWRLTLRTARAQISALLICVLFLSALAVAVTARAARLRAEGELAVELTAHLRQLALELSYMALTDPVSIASSGVEQAFVSSLALLRDGGELRGLAGLEGRLSPEQDPALLALLGRVQVDWARFSQAIAALAGLAPGAPGHEEAVRAVAATALMVAIGLDELQRAYQLALEAGEAQATLEQLALLAGVIGLGLWGAVLVRRRVLRPAELLAAVRPGMPAAALDRLATYDDEVRQLLRVFEAMRPELESSQGAGQAADARLLLAAFEASRAVVEQREVAGVVEVATARAREIVGAGRSSLCLDAPATTDGASRAAPLRLVDDTAAPLGLAGCPDCAEGPPDAGDQRVAITVQAGGVRLGALCVARAGAAPFTPADLRALEVIGQAAGVAITNIRLTQAGHYHAEQSAVRAERERLAAELHDNLAQTLTYLRLGVERVRAKVASHASDDALAEIDHVESTTRQAYSTVRTVLRDLRSPEPPPARPVADEIAAFVADYRRMTGLEVRLDLDAAALARLTPLAQTQALHIVREALSNTHRHANARRASVQTRLEGDALALLIEDDGQGFDTAAALRGEQLGLTIMRTRAAQCGGALTISVAPGAGTSVAATFPLNRPA